MGQGAEPLRPLLRQIGVQQPAIARLAQKPLPQPQARRHALPRGVAPFTKGAVQLGVRVRIKP